MDQELRKLEEHVVVVSSVRWKMLEEEILKDGQFVKIKQDKANSFYWPLNENSFQENAAKIRSRIQNIPRSNIIIYQIMPVLNGKLDLFDSPLPLEKKIQLPYYQMKHKDLSERELKEFILRQKSL